MSSNKYTKEQIVDAVTNSISIRQVLIKLGLKPAGGNYTTIHRLVKEYSLDTSHFKGQGSNGGKIFPPRRPIEDYLENRQTIQSYKLKKAVN